MKSISSWIEGKYKNIIRDKTHWAKLRVKGQKGTSEQYIDILVGKKGKKPHAHFGINLDQTLRFLEPRSVLHSLERDVENLKTGDKIENKCVVADSSAKPAKVFVLKLNLDGSSGEVSVAQFSFSE